jgi:hypothetical protein
MPVNPTKPETPVWDSGHALAANAEHYYALTEGTGTAPAAANGGSAASFSGSPTWTTNAEGAAVSIAAKSGLVIPAPVTTTGDFTFAMRWKPLAYNGSYTIIVDTPARPLSLFVSATDLTYWNYSAVSIPHGMAVDGIYTLAVTRSGTLCTLYVDGASLGTISSAVELTAISIGPNPSDGGNGVTAEILGAATWSAALSPSLLTDLADDFWAPTRSGSTPEPVAPVSRRTLQYLVRTGGI